MEIFLKDGWHEIPSSECETYDNFLKVVRSLGEYDFVSDIHVKNLFVFPASSKRFWARNSLVLESKLILQDKVSAKIIIEKVKRKLVNLHSSFTDYYLLAVTCNTKIAIIF